MITKSIPSIFTLGNLFLGMMAIILAVQGDPTTITYASILVIIGAILDGLDGRVARMLNATSEFGKELDSLADIVSFGVAPAVIMYLVVLHEMGPWGIMITVLFPLCGALRLARFSVQSGASGVFIGLPITAAGGALALLALYYQVIPPSILLSGMLILSFLMISNIKYPKLKKVGVSRATFWITPIVIGVVALLAYHFPSHFPMIVFVPLVLYLAYGIKKSIDSSVRKKRRLKRWPRKKKAEQE